MPLLSTVISKSPNCCLLRLAIALFGPCLTATHITVLQWSTDFSQLMNFFSKTYLSELSNTLVILALLTFDDK